MKKIGLFFFAVAVWALASEAGALTLTTTSTTLPIPGPASGEGIVPELYSDNPDCSEIGNCGDDVDWFEFKIEDGLTDGFYTDGVLNVYIDVNPDEGEGLFFDWYSNLGVYAVIVKGGTYSNVYKYDPVNFDDTYLHAPMNPNKDFQYPHAISHIAFCYGSQPVPEPATLLLMGVGMAGLAGLRMKRKIKE